MVELSDIDAKEYPALAELERKRKEWQALPDEVKFGMRNL
jgi:hypothetical protein